MEGFQHFFAALLPKETDGVCIDISEEKRYGAVRSAGLGRDVVRMKAQLLFHVGACRLESLSEGCDGDVLSQTPHYDGT